MTSALPAAPMTRPETTVLAGLALSQVVLFLIPVVVLGRAIGWPASLRLPARDALALVGGNVTAVQIGYWGYLLTVLALVPFVLALRRFAQAHGADGLITDAMTAFGLLAAVLKSLGIVRWLVAMPDLARSYSDATDPALRAALEVTYGALNGYAGSVGELLGVQLFSGVWLILLVPVFRRAGWRFHAVAVALIGSGFALTAFRTVEPGLGALGTVIPPIALVWLLALSATVWRQRTA